MGELTSSNLAMMEGMKELFWKERDWNKRGIVYKKDKILKCFPIFLNFQ